MDIPRVLIDDIRAGRAVLFLGAGASAGALNSENQGPPLGNTLRNLIVDKFLSANYEESSLATVSDLAASETDLFRMQDFVADQFRGLKPANFHQDLASFRWRAIASTNYDQVIEASYQLNEARCQDLVTILSNEDRVDDKLRTQDQLAFLKLHGCISITHREDLPLILTIEQYVTHMANRHLLFQRLEGLANECPVVFIGHKLEDTNIRAMLLRLSTLSPSRPRYYLIDPNIDDIQFRFWEGKKITSIKGTLENFITTLKTEIPAETRPLLKLIQTGHPITHHFRVNEELPPRIAQMLDEDVEYVYAGMRYETGTPNAFYRGFDLGWYPVRESLDVRRRLVDTLLTDVVIRPEEDRSSPTELYVVKAEAGAGKSVFLRRLAWDAAIDAESLVLFVRKYGSPSPDDLAELIRLTGKRIFLIWDNAADNSSEIGRFMTNSLRKDLPITVITAERVNEWNMSCDRLDRFLADIFDLRYLNEEELRNLAILLETYNSLGPNLRGKTLDQRVDELKDRTGRQLLVALHEATMGAPFEEILQNEYENLRPIKAQNLYLTICVLNRLRTPVRTGFISRVHDISFENFKEELFHPLESVVKVEQRHSNSEFFYQARHPEIAQIVFTRMLSNRMDRLNEYLRIIANLNLSYNTDRESFRGLIKAKHLVELFPDYQDVKAIFEKAEAVGKQEAFLYQQRANYERIRPDGNLKEAEDYLKAAREMDPKDTSIVHTLAEVYRSRAEQAQTQLSRQKYRKEACAIIKPLLGQYRPSDSYARVTLVKIHIDELNDVINDEKSSETEIDASIRAVDQALDVGLKNNPGEQFLLTAEADFSNLVADHERSFTALKKAFLGNPRDSYIANRLARVYQSRGNLKGAQETLAEALKANRGDPRLNFRYAETLREQGEQDPEILAYHYERSFTPGDRLYEEQFWFARFAFECSEKGRRNKSVEIFRTLRSAAMSHSKKFAIRDFAKNSDGRIKFQGVVDRIESSYGKICRDGLGDFIFVHAKNVDESTWATLQRGNRINFELGYNFSGPNAVHIEKL